MIMARLKANRYISFAEIISIAVAVIAVALGFFLGLEALGITASVISFVLWFPQAVKVWQSRRDPHALSGVSLSTQVLVLANAVLWAGYGIETGALWVAAPGLINGPLALMVLGLIIGSRGTVALRGETSTTAVAPCELCSENKLHQVFITTPPGWGSVVTCSEHTRRHGIIVTSDDDIAALRFGRE